VSMLRIPPPYALETELFTTALFASASVPSFSMPRALPLAIVMRERLAFWPASTVTIAVAKE
jgi:hypothetical protein